MGNRAKRARNAAAGPYGGPDGRRFVRPAGPANGTPYAYGRTFPRVMTPLLLTCRTGVAVHRVAAEHAVRRRDVQHHIGPADGHGHRAVHRVVHPVHGAVLRAADDVHNRAVRAHRAPAPALRQAETHHHGAVVQGRKEDFVPGVQGQLVVESAQNAR